MSHSLNVRVAGVRLSVLLHLYKMRLRSHAVQELLAGSGIAVGVALVLGVLVANQSLTGSAGQLVHEVVGSARLQIDARSQLGFDQGLSTVVSSLPGVRVAAPVLRENVGISGPRGRAAVQLIGITPQAVHLGSLETRTNLPGGAQLVGGLLLPKAVADATGATAGQSVVVSAFGSVHRVFVRGVLDGSTFGVVASSPIAVTSLPAAQQLTGLPNRITQLYVKPAPGADARVRGELAAAAGPNLDVESAAHELDLLDQAAGPNDRSTELFAAISVMVGFLLALNAMLLTVPERRRFVADLRIQGYDWRQITAMLASQAIVLGLTASIVGVVFGVLLSHIFLHGVPAYLTAAFPIGSQQIVSAQTVVLAISCGVLATLLASLSPLLDLRPNRPADAALREREGGSEVIAPRTTLQLALAALASTALITWLVLIEPNLTIAGGVALAISMLCAIPALFAILAGVLRWTGERVRSSALIVVVSELRATTTRTVALAGIAALAVYGSVAIGGARHDLLRGLDTNFAEYLQTGDVWVTPGGTNLGTTTAFAPRGLPRTLARLPGVTSVRPYQGAFVDDGRRRMWVIARSSGDTPLVPRSQLVSGNARDAEELLAGRGWATVSNSFAAEHRLRRGARFSLPTPSGPLPLRVAAITTNLGWPPGAVILSDADFVHWWRTDFPSALEIGVRPGVDPEAVRTEIARVAGPGLDVQTFAQRRRQYDGTTRQGLQALSEIATLVLIAAALAVAAALSAAIWQRRARLAALKIQGYDTPQLWRALLLESTVVLGVGSIVGAGFGVLGHALAVRWLRLSTGFPAPFTVGLPEVFLTIALLAIIALAVISRRGWGGAGAPARASFGE